MKSLVPLSVIGAVSTASALTLPDVNFHNPPGPPSHPPHPVDPSPSTWDLQDFTSLVVFGDSYSDDSRLGYFIENDGQAPPVGWVNPPNPTSSTGGRIWGQYVVQYTGVNLYNYAVSGAVCSNKITPRWLSLIDGPFPSVAEYEVPAYFADAGFVTESGENFLEHDPSSTVYAIWDGTNDLGYYAFIQDEQVAGTDITTYIDCIYEQISRLYDNGGRYFVLFNIGPLNLSPQYAAPPYDVGPDLYWPDKPANHTLLAGRMLEEVVTVNEIYKYRTPFDVVLTNTFPGARFASFDVHDLMLDIYNNPSEYLNGSAPLDVNGYVSHCNITGGDCVADPSPDSFLWFDPLHPSEQADRIIAQNFVDVVKGASKWATYWSS